MMQATVRQAVQAGATNSNGHAHAARDPTSPPYGHIGRRFHRPASRQCRPRESSKAGSNKPRHAREVTTMTDTQPAAPQAPAPSDEQARETAKVAPPTGADWRHAFRDRVKDQLGVRGMVSEYLIPVETNTFWYSLGGVLGISLVLEILLLALIAMHYYLIKVKGISLPFWHKPTGRRVPFSTHIREWSIYSVFILGAILVVSFFHRSAGPEPQLLPTSEFYGSKHGPGGLGIVPTFPITWTHGMNRFVTIAFGLEPDIWGTVIGMVLMTAALVAIPYLDRGGPVEPRTWGEALSLQRRGWAYLAIVVFWAVMIIGVVTNLVTPVG